VEVKNTPGGDSNPRFTKGFKRDGKACYKVTRGGNGLFPEEKRGGSDGLGGPYLVCSKGEKNRNLKREKKKGSIAR